jgi:hypothetical protein
MNLNESCFTDAFPTNFLSSCGSCFLLTVIETDFRCIPDGDDAYVDLIYFILECMLANTEIKLRAKLLTHKCEECTKGVPSRVCILMDFFNLLFKPFFNQVPRPDKSVRRAGSGPRTVVWTALHLKASLNKQVTK